MKTQMKKYLVVLGGILAPAMVLAQGFTPAVPEGSYRGLMRGLEEGRVRMLTETIRGCEGCFVAVLFKDRPAFLGLGDAERRIDTYKAVPLHNQKITVRGKNDVVGEINTSNEYSLTPFGVDTDGEITTPNANPSYILTVQKNIGASDVHFELTSASSDNKSGPQTSMIFSGNESSFDLDDGKPGRYKIPMHLRSSGSINIITTNSQDGSRVATATLLGNDHEAGGTFMLKEKAPGVFTFSAISHLATGAVVQEMPKKIVVFMKHCGRERAYLVNPTNDKDVSELKVVLL